MLPTLDPSQPLTAYYILVLATTQVLIIIFPRQDTIICFATD